MRMSVLISLIMLSSVPDSYAQATSPASPAEPHYLVFQMGTENKDFGTILPELKAEFGAQPALSSHYLGFGVALMTLKTPIEALGSQVTRALDAAEETGLPVLIKLDDVNFTPETMAPSMLEWTALPNPGEAHGPLAPHYWLNWGSWMALPPPPNLESAAFRQDVKRRLIEGVLPPLLQRLSRWQEQRRAYLFAGICLGWETGIPEYRPLRQTTVLPRDTQRNITMSKEELGEQLGYASLYSRGWTQQKIQDEARMSGQSEEDVITELLWQVMHDYSAFWAKTVHDAGIPKERIYTHGVAWESLPPDRLPAAWMRKSSRVPPVWVNVNTDSRPGYTVGSGQFDAEGLVTLMAEAGAAHGWGAVEAYVRGVESQDAFGRYLRELFDSGAQLVDIFGWTAPGSPYDPQRAPGALRAIHAWLEGKELPRAPALAAPQQAITPGAAPPSLDAKLHRLGALIEQRTAEGADVQPVGELMEGFDHLMQQQRFAEAEALVDRALKLAEEGPHKIAQAGPPPWLEETMRRVKPPTPDDPDFMIYQFMGDPQHPERVEPWVKKLQADFGRQKPGQSKYIGFGFFIQDMNDDVATLKGEVETLLGFAEKYDMPLFVHLDGVLFWDRRTDGLPENPEAVEWSGFPGAGQ